MSKKIYDILPPKMIHKVEDATKSLSLGKKSKKRSKKNSHQQSVKKFPLKEVLVGGSIIVFLLGIYFYNKLPKADIQVWPTLDTLTLQETIVADKNIDEVNLSGKLIPAQYIEQTETSQQEFQATGIASNDSKASGTIKIYNKINPASPFTLKIGTHFLSNSGKYFVTLSKITIPAAQGKNPGSIKVKVQAQESGPDYNIKPSKFSVPKLSGTIYYYNIFAESDEPMTGGYTGNVKKVTKDDIAQAKETLTKSLLSKAENALKGKLSPDDILLDGAISRSVIETNSDVKADSITDKFTESAKVKVSALVFKKQDLEKFAKDDIVSQLPDSKTFLEDSLDISYDSELIDIQGGIETLVLQLSAKTYEFIDKNSLVDLVSRKSFDQIKDIFDEKYPDTVSEIKINFWPFWVNKAPKDKNRIKIDLLFQ